MRRNIILKAPAKVNLTLDVKGKRSDGYHELETVMHQVNLLDIIIISQAAGGIQIKSNSSLIPTNEENLAYQAAEMILGEYAHKEGVEIYIEKNIPVGAGLAGGSTDAAAVILGINQLYDLGLEEEELLEMAASIGSDVAFCLAGGSKLARGRGEILSKLPQRMIPYIILVKPDFQLSTAEVYRELDLTQVEEFPDNAAFLAAWEAYDIINIARNMRNVLETVSIRKYPEIAAIKAELIETGALNALMSGSGPSVMGIFMEEEQALKAREKFQTRYQEVFLLSSYV
ncbi:4-(cytidine 5'-diphospho)-2-C-methyl-D-erythritol kinase [Syntrophomonas wolfei]|uniref:4-diphosphocytidyl-2-C-methyl-D-erythritol kinase n=1 Tax=Syntrophomonas wolfei subsp. wolfei (strain DSM 2245B / Goettingen) TaxID=335541 RepID=ISPE_SYNWW|nr:4-(cytidine 5'-diphospho)-2-C-methyl-D-erythritol kinase [Syntrophomonas wolfei]Q0B0T2.1 RecName: Full=4-diphosphocytidyl-2-C-methyl-D-erythritol kinase; Short=CMK; AltName: Full=4-(cytidine-5'-diphospho)-2-C-methyl-D-erythritol kinase [Syntrophomonas wolfei subsp. wolfei str. Goettingen G311]ABI67422.1 4-diphosphocytidyl-2-C-methyl-D-erythritol kinase [Syntrophomonas wolfei subsp. wolfei str. Goettingen G311]